VLETLMEHENMTPPPGTLHETIERLFGCTRPREPDQRCARLRAEQCPRPEPGKRLEQRVREYGRQFVLVARALGTPEEAQVHIFMQSLPLEIRPRIEGWIIEDPSLCRKLDQVQHRAREAAALYDERIRDNWAPPQQQQHQTPRRAVAAARSSPPLQPQQQQHRQQAPSTHLCLCPC
jgi:hypothetical protein